MQTILVTGRSQPDRQNQREHALMSVVPAFEVEALAFECVLANGRSDATASGQLCIIEGKVLTGNAKKKNAHVKKQCQYYSTVLAQLFKADVIGYTFLEHANGPWSLAKQGVSGTKK